MNAPLPRLHVVTDDRVLERDDWDAVAAEVLAAGGARIALHLRGAGLTGRRLYERARALIGTAAGAGAALVVNDRVDIATALPVSGVQLRETSLPVREARRLLGPERWIGASVHGAGRAREADGEGADYLVVGTLFATPSHPDRAGAGPALLAQVGAATRLPLVAIGGVTPDRVRAAREAGAYGVAVLGGVWKAREPADSVGLYLSALEG